MVFVKDGKIGHQLLHTKRQRQASTITSLLHHISNRFPRTVPSTRAQAMQCIVSKHLASKQTLRDGCRREYNKTSSTTQSDHEANQQLSRHRQRSPLIKPESAIKCHKIIFHAMQAIHIVVYSKSTFPKSTPTHASITNPISAHEILFHNTSLRPTIVLRPPNPLPPSTTTNQPPRINNVAALKCQRERLSLRIRQNQRVR